GVGGQAGVVLAGAREVAEAGGAVVAGPGVDLRQVDHVLHIRPRGRREGAPAAAWQWKPPAAAGNGDTTRRSAAPTGVHGWCGWGLPREHDHFMLAARGLGA